MLLVDRRVVGQPVERDAECRLARCPNDALYFGPHRRREDGVRACDVGPEDEIRRGVHGRRDRRQVNDRVDNRHPLGAAVENLERLAEVGEIGGEERRGRVGSRRFRRRHDVDVQDVVAALEQVTDDRATGLAAATGDDDPHRPQPFTNVAVGDV